MKITFIFHKHHILVGEKCIIKKQWEMVPHRGDSLAVEDGNHIARGTVQMVYWDTEGLPEVYVLGIWRAAE